MNLPNPGMSFNALDPLPASDLNDMVENIEALADPASYADGDIPRNVVANQGDGMFDYVLSGCVITGTGYGSTLAWSMTSGVVYINGKRYTVSSATGTVTASKDTYFDVLAPGSGAVASLVNTGGNIVNNNAASPSLAANSIRIGIVVSGASSIASVASINQGQENKVLPIASSLPYAVTDSIGNLICPRDVQRRVLGYRQIVSNFTTTTTPANVDVPGLIVPFLMPMDNGAVKLTVYGSQVYASGSNVYGSVYAILDGTTIQNGTSRSAASAADEKGMLIIGLKKDLAVGSHTAKVQVSQSGAGTMLLAGFSTSPGYILVERI